MSLSISQVADLAGISARMLRHYDKLGLLHPSRVSNNGYRWYEREQLLRLQRILLLRDYGLSLASIKDILSRNDAAGERAALIAHRELVAEERDRLTRLLSTLDLTLDEMAGGRPFAERDFFAGLRTSRAELRSELLERFGPPVDAAFAAEEKRTADWNEQDFEAAATRGNVLYGRLATAMQQGHLPQSTEAATLVRAHHDLISEGWVPGREAYEGLASLYLESGFQRDLVAGIHPDLPEWLAAAMQDFALKQL
ncbi:hypothetical protein ART_2909 [Arthrobacter sp. PAMC 25486]|uniref:MerR family transcriptional regulator n=1 Tax=Arthrobacter sp. PAMC 25486 TaxID=1494608 RepID=UPI000535A82F|nr:MerR family transcriptional regulator [Arthrobacter sp. PAMC 25486]AIY02508.1 hypothetical protein ART_2909 [Arthrobacter sp. PAMC 25486]